MQSPIIKIDTLKPIGTLVDLTGQFNARVGDAYTPITIQWTEGGNAKNLDGLHPVFEAAVGQGHVENNEVLMNDDAVPVRWVGDQSSIRGYGQTILKLPPQVFSKSGLCYGYLALENDQGVRETSVDIWFKVLGGVYNMGLACNYFITDFQKALAKAKGDVFHALDEIKKNYELKIQSAENAIDDNVAALKNLKDSVGAIQAQIDAGNVVTLTKHNTDIDRISKAIEDKLAQMDLQPEAFENEAALRAKYPNGKSGIMVTIDTGHNWVWANNVWKDCGIYQAAGVTTYKLNKIISGADDLVAPYDDLDTLPANSTVSYAAPCDVKNKPTDINDNFTVHTFSNSTSNDDTHAGNGKMQALMAGDTLYWRMSWGPVYYGWQKINKRSRTITTKDQLAAPYDDLNTLPINTAVTYRISDGVQNKPYTSASFFTVFTFGDNSIGATQLLASQNDSLYWRASWSDGKNSYYGWQNLNPAVDNVIITSNDQLKSPYDDMDTIPVNSTVVYGIDQSKLKHLPEDVPNTGFTIDTRGYGKGNITGAVQMLVALSGAMYYRIAWGYPSQYRHWHKIQQETDQTIVLDYRSPSLSLFDKFAVIGDSYSAGSMELSDGTWIDSQNNQWGLMLARKYGTNYTSLAKGGASAGTFLTDTLPKLKASDPQDIYYLILGINDSMDTTKTTGQMLGTPDDMHDDSSTNPGTFYGNYAKIIDAVKTKSPKAKIIMFTIMAHTEFRQDYNEAIKKIAAHYGIVVADVNQDPLFDSDYYINHMKGGHPTAPLYAAQAEALERVIQKTIADNPDYFSDAAALAE